jgi:hypothetical protein
MPNELMVTNQPPKTLETFADCMQAARALKKGDDAGMKDLLMAMARLRVQDKLDDIQIGMVLQVIHESTKLEKKIIKGGWKKYKEDANKWWAEELAKWATENAANFARARQQAMDAERKRLWESCSPIAESPDLLAGVEAIAHQVLGVVNEGAAVRSTYLTATSRLLEGKAVRVLRTGASASGKNYPVEQGLKFFPAHAVMHVSGASPKSLPYEGGDDPYALMHRLIYAPEAVIIGGKKAGDAVNEYALMFRTLLSEGVLVYKTVVVDPATGQRQSLTIVKHGPIAAILTTADEVDDQLETRCLVQNTDESGAQTEAIVESIFSDADENAPHDLQPWIDYQLLLEMDKPPRGYRVRVPFKMAVRKAFRTWRPGFLKRADMRMRRDADSFLVAIKASAVTHKFQRQTAEDGTIIATIDDYRHAVEAFDEGLASAHGHIDKNVIATVEAVEAMRDETPESDLDPDSGLESRVVKVSVRDLCKRLRIKSTSTAKDRLHKAVSVGVLEYDDTKHGGRGRPHYFRVLKSSAKLRVEPHAGVFPPAEVVRKIFSASPLNTEQNEQFGEDARKTRI